MDTTVLPDKVQRKWECTNILIGHGGGGGGGLAARDDSLLSAFVCVSSQCVC